MGVISFFAPPCQTDQAYALCGTASFGVHAEELRLESSYRHVLRTRIYVIVPKSYLVPGTGMSVYSNLNVLIIMNVLWTLE